MNGKIELLSAETERGVAAIEEVMAHSYSDDIGTVPPKWALARVVDDVPVSFILVDPARQMEYPAGDLRYAFIAGVATREDRRGEGHFRGIMQAAFARLRKAGIPLVITHGRCQLYRRFGFDVFTHHCGIFINPEQIERHLGAEVQSAEAESRAFDASHREGGERLIEVFDERYVLPELLLVSDVRAKTPGDSRQALLAAAALARQRGKVRILFEHPAAPSYGRRYPIYSTLDTPFSALARACGAEVRVQGGDPESGPVPDADWVKVLDTPLLLAEVLRCQPPREAPSGAVCLENDAGSVTIDCAGGSVKVLAGAAAGVPVVEWPVPALAQLATGYQSPAILATERGLSAPAEALALLGALFPRRWRLSRNESWTYKA